MTKFVFSAILTAASMASASTAVLECRDFKGRTIFAGVVRTDVVLQIGYGEGIRIPFTQALSSNPVMVLDRVTLQRKIGITLPNCDGPYARVYARLGKGELACESIEISQTTDVNWTDKNVLGLLLPKSEVPCAVTLPPATLKGLK